MKKSEITFIPLGGVGEFGTNAAIIQSEKTSILIDFGLMFPPDSRQPGVEYYVIDPEKLLQDFPDLSAIFITHGHEDHIGGLPYLIALKKLPIFTMPYTAGLIRNRLDRFDLKTDLNTVSLNEPVKHFDLEVEFIGVTHSIVQACALRIQCGDVCMIHSGDFKVDALPGDDYPFQSSRLAELGHQGVDVLIMDSTNANKTGFCPSDFEIVETLEEQDNSAKGRVFFTTFSSHIPRLRKLRGIAERTGRKIVLIGRSFMRHYANSLDSRYLSHVSDVFIDGAEAKKLPEDQLIYVVTGSQGEPNAALAKISKDRFQGVKLKQGDTVIFSSRAIPGNERVVALMMSEMQANGVHVVSSYNHKIHTSGHGYREDSAYMLALTQPKTVIPIHGEFSHLLLHRDWLKELIGPKQEVMLVQNGDLVHIHSEKTQIKGQMEIDQIPVDGNQDLFLSQDILRQRKDMMYSGFVLVNVDEGSKGFQVEVKTFGLVSEGSFDGALRSSLKRSVNKRSKPKDVYLMAKKWIKKAFFGRPIVQLVMNGQIFEPDSD